MTNTLKRFLLPFLCVLLGMPRIFAAGAEEAPALHPLSTLDHSAYRLTLRLIDFDAPQNAYLLDNSRSTGISAHPGLLSGYLGEDGYPFNGEGVSMASVFADAAVVNHLFLEEPVRTSGLWEFDSTECFASLNGDRFVVYQELGTIDVPYTTTMDHGQFLPFNDLTPGLLSTHHPTNERDALNNELSAENPRKGESLYAVDGAANHYFGLEMEAEFLYPASGHGAQGEELVAYFTGDDDLWVYIDGVLILDLGGIHSAIPGSINFSTGAVTYRGSDGKDATTKLYKLFRQRYAEQHPEARDREIQEYLDQIFVENMHWQMVFREDTAHTIKLYYMERGAGASNLHIRFNLPVVEN